EEERGPRRGAHAQRRRDDEDGAGEHEPAVCTPVVHDAKRPYSPRKKMRGASPRASPARTSPTKMVWSPAGWTAWTRQSSQPMASSRIGAPVLSSRNATPLNFSSGSAPANLRDSHSPWKGRMFTAKYPAR